MPTQFGPAPTAFGAVHVTVAPDIARGPRVEWSGDWHRNAPPIEVRLPGFQPISLAAASGSIELKALEESS
jgi:hypothetical protein